MTTPLAQLRLDLAQAKADLRQRKDTLDTAKIVATLHVAGKNDDERKKATARALLDSTAYALALVAVRDAEADIDTLEAQIQNEEDQIRLRELQARERLADALLGRRTDDAAADTVRLCTCDECQAERERRKELIARAHQMGRREPVTDDWYKTS